MDSDDLCGKVVLSETEAVAKGMIEPGSKSGVELAREQLEKEQQEKTRDAKRRKREAKRNARD